MKPISQSLTWVPEIIWTEYKESRGKAFYSRRNGRLIHYQWVERKDCQQSEGKFEKSIMTRTFQKLRMKHVMEHPM